MNSEILIREAIPETPTAKGDMPFILDTWKQTWRTSPFAGTIRNDQYYDVISSTIEGLVLRGAVFTVAYHPSRPSYILAWACTEQARDGKCIVHYLYCKDAYLGSPARDLLIEAAPGEKPGLFSHHYRTVVDTCRSGRSQDGGRTGWRWAPETARRK